jgi:hypothetical protein
MGEKFAANPVTGTGDLGDAGLVQVDADYQRA